jgi:hypothetical protein
MRIQVQVREVYGRKVVYPVCEQGKLFAAIAGTTTLTPQALRYIGRLGVKVDEIKRSLMEEVK